jgi:hypothetical protein
MRFLFLISFTAVTIAGAAQTRVNLSDSTKTKKGANAPYALVAGGSKGIGFAIAEALAKRKFNLILIARHPEALNNAEQQLESKYGVEVKRSGMI